MHFEPLSNNEIRGFLEKNYQITIKSDLMLEAFQGSIGKALKIQEKYEIYENVEEIIKTIQKKSIVDILKTSEIIYKSKDEIFDILEFINIIVLNLAMTSHKYAKCVQIVENTKKRLKSNANYDMSIDNMLLKMKEAII